MKQGSCIGTSLGTYPGVEEEGDCWQLCQDEPDCEYYTFDWTSGGFCFVFSTCPVIDDTCRTCSTSEDDCPLLSCQVPGECLGILVITCIHMLQIVVQSNSDNRGLSGGGLFNCLSEFKLFW